jgi:hypothetical protein
MMVPSPATLAIPPGVKEDIQNNVPIHHVRHTVTRHLIVHAGDSDLDDASTAEATVSAFSVQMQSRALKAEKAAQLRRFQVNLRRRVAEVEAAKSTEADLLADEMTNIELIVAGGRGGGAHSGRPSTAPAGGRVPRPELPSALEMLLATKAAGVQSSHRALLSQAHPAAFGASRQAGSGVEAIEGPGRVRAAKDAYADSQRKSVASMREKERRTARRREEARLQRVAAAEAEAFSAAQREAALAKADPEVASRIRARTHAKAEEERRRVERRMHAERVVQRARYAEALQDTIKAQLVKKHIVLPPLCTCPHATKSQPFDLTAVYRCAHNCPLHNDEAAYHAALSQMLAAHDILIAPPPAL